MATLDPIVSLAVALAEAPGLYAFLLGSGVSRDAGVPTGGEVLRIARADLYRLETGESELPGDQELSQWLDQAGHAGHSYSELLALLGPDPEARRAYLAKHFEGREPGETHRLLAELAAEKLIRIFLTTNFDRLLESALAAVGVIQVVVTGAADLRRASEREHAAVYVVKPHGDYLQQTIRNTADELEALEAEIESEVQEIFDRYGLVLVGYSGSDPAIARLLRKRNSRYGAYWVSRTSPAAELAVLVEALHARVIVRDSASEFLVDLKRRIDAFRAHPSGETPDMVSAAVVALLRARDEIGVRELLKKEWRVFHERLAWSVESLAGESTPARGPEFERAIMPGLERLLAALVPLIEHRSSMFEEQVAEMVRTTDRAMESRVRRPWSELEQWAMWWLAKALGAFAVCTRNYVAVGDLLATHVRQLRKTGSLLSMLVRPVGQDVAKTVMEQYSTSNWIAPYWEHLAKCLNESPFLKERYPELVEEPGVRAWLDELDFLTSYGALRRGENPVIPYWALTGDGAQELARRLSDDDAFRDEVARGAFRMSGDEFAETARSTFIEALEEPRRLLPLGPWGWNSEAINALPVPSGSSEAGG